MRPADAGHRRDFLRTTGLAAGLAAAGGLPVAAAARPARADGPDAVLKRLLEGNERFMKGQTSLLARRRPEDFAALAAGQAPPAIILSCADSRVPPELVFDQGVGDLFVVRVAGNIATGAGPVVKASLEFAVAELGARLILVMGHTACGAVKAAIEHIDKSDALPGSIGQLVDAIRPAVVDAKDEPGDRLDNVIRANVRKCIATIKGLDPILSDFARNQGLKVVGGVYDLKTGKVDVFA
jgi:carbonic anhydrase